MATSIAVAQTVAIPAQAAQVPVAIPMQAANAGYGGKPAAAAPAVLAAPLGPVLHAVAVVDVDAIVRMGFIRKVYGILVCQLLVTFGLMLGTMHLLEDECEARTGLCTGLFYSSFVVGFGTMIAIMCCGNNARIYPRNYILLGVCTVACGVMLGVICTFYTAESVLLAAGMTVLMAVGLTAFACQTKWDFVGSAPYIFAALLTLVLFGLCIPLYHGRTETASTRGVMWKIYAGLGCLVFSFFIVYDTQLIVGIRGTRRHK